MPALDGLYVKRSAELRTTGVSPESPGRDPGDVLEMQNRRAPGEQGDASDDFTSERAQEALESERGDSEVTESMTSSGVMEENLDVGAEADGTGPSVGGPPDMRAPRRSAAANRKDSRKPPDSAVQE